MTVIQAAGSAGPAAERAVGTFDQLVEGLLEPAQPWAGAGWTLLKKITREAKIEGGRTLLILVYCLSLPSVGGQIDLAALFHKLGTLSFHAVFGLAALAFEVGAFVFG
jgi:hypothetical protein